MNIGDVYGGSVEVHSSAHGGGAGLVNTYTVIPTAPRPGTDPAPFVVTSYEITQMPTGSGIYLLFYDATAAPAAGTAWFGNPSDADNVLWTVPLIGGAFVFACPPAGHRYLRACTIVVSAGSDPTQLQLASEQTLVCVHGFPWLV